MRLYYCLSVILLFGCKKFVQVNPPRTQLVTEDVFKDDASATAAINGLYSMMIQDIGFASINTTYYAGMSSDEMIDFSNVAVNAQIYSNSIESANTNILYFWGNLYQYIYAANAMIEGLQTSAGVSVTGKQELTAEAKLVRAFCYFYLVNFFGDVPLITGTNYQKNAVAIRSPAGKVYDQVIADLKSAQISLPADYSISNGERVRPILWAANALLARAYLYEADWADAEIQSTSVIDNSNLYNLNSDPNEVFLANSSESIWQLEPVSPGYNTWEGNIFILTGNPSGNYFGVALSSALVNAFEPGDLRFSAWVSNYTDPGSGMSFYYPFKYKVQANFTVTEYYTILRLAEQYLIRAEARAKQNNMSGALSDINIIRTRAGLPVRTALDQDSVFHSIEQERRIELFAEWGHRWLDLKRTSRVSAVMTPLKADWQATDSLYPIPLTERQNDPNLKQNPGYN